MAPVMMTVPFLCAAVEALEAFGSGKWMVAPVFCMICLMFAPLRPIMNRWCCGAISSCMLTGTVA